MSYILAVVFCNIKSLLVFKFIFCSDASFESEILALALHVFYTFITVTIQNQYSFRKCNRAN